MGILACLHFLWLSCLSAPPGGLVTTDPHWFRLDILNVVLFISLNTEFYKPPMACCHYQVMCCVFHACVTCSNTYVLKYEHWIHCFILKFLSLWLGYFLIVIFLAVYKFGVRRYPNYTWRAVHSCVVTIAWSFGSVWSIGGHAWSLAVCKLMGRY